MIIFTKQEKAAVFLLAAALLLGSFLQLFKKKCHDNSFFGIPRIVRKIRINSANREEWESLPAIGEYRAAMILEARERKGGFSSIEEVRYVKGIGPHVFNQIRDYLDED